MPKSNPILIDALRSTAQNLVSGAKYEWGHMGRCNCGHLVQTLTNMTDREIVDSIDNRMEEWTEHAREYCASTGSKVDYIFDTMQGFGFDSHDMINLEYLSDIRILKKISNSNTPQYLRNNNVDDVILYMETMADLLESELEEVQEIRFKTISMKIQKKYIISPSIIFLVLFGLQAFAQDEDEGLGWPREIEKKGSKVTFYQPQLESYEDNVLEGRMAISLKNKDTDPLFGAVWFQTDVSTDFTNRKVSFNDLSFTRAAFPEVDEKEYKISKDFVMKEVGKWDLVMTLDRFLASLETIDNDPVEDEKFNMDPPEIYFRKEPAVLIMIDGGATFKPTDEDNLMTVINTPYFVVYDTKKTKYYLNGGEWWWESDKIDVGWKQIKKPPKHVKIYNDQVKKNQDTELDSAALEMDNPPEVIVSTVPSELILSDGEPQFNSVGGESKLLHLTNSENDVLLDIELQQYYILISGRWFRSSSLSNGPWTFVRPDRLPEDFYKIPEDSEIANVRVSIPDTPEAKDAMLENTIPQTAEVDRHTATAEVTYDGDPRFEPIDGTEMYYAVNTDKSVLLINNMYYLVDEAIWFVSPTPKGPWEVCVEVPEEVRDIPPASPMYNVQYVYIYDYTDDVVYVGYTPAYYGSYVVHGTVIYGTGYYYQPWYGAVYYPRPVTYGYGVHYNPWTGWGFSVGVSYGWIHFSARAGGYWGYGGYRYGYRHGYRSGARHGYRRGYTAGRRAGYRAGYRSGQRSSNIYGGRSNGVRSTGTRASAANRASTGQAPRRSNQPNNVYSDRSGNTYKRDNNGSWQQRDNKSGNWQNYDRSNSGSRDRASTQDRQNRNTGAATQQNRNRATQNRNTQNRNTQNQSYNPSRDYQNRNRGTQRTNSYNRSSSRPSGGRSGGRGRR